MPDPPRRALQPPIPIPTQRNPRHTPESGLASHHQKSINPASTFLISTINASESKPTIDPFSRPPKDPADRLQGKCRDTTCICRAFGASYHSRPRHGWMDGWIWGGLFEPWRVMKKEMDAQHRRPDMIHHPGVAAATVKRKEDGAPRCCTGTHTRWGLPRLDACKTGASAEGGRAFPIAQSLWSDVGPSSRAAGALPSLVGSVWLGSPTSFASPLLLVSCARVSSEGCRLLVACCCSLLPACIVSSTLRLRLCLEQPFCHWLFFGSLDSNKQT